METKPSFLGFEPQPEGPNKDTLATELGTSSGFLFFIFFKSVAVSIPDLDLLLFTTFFLFLSALKTRDGFV